MARGYQGQGSTQNPINPENENPPPRSQSRSPPVRFDHEYALQPNYGTPQPQGPEEGENPHYQGQPSSYTRQAAGPTPRPYGKPRSYTRQHFLQGHLDTDDEMEDEDHDDEDVVMADRGESNDNPLYEHDVDLGEYRSPQQAAPRQGGPNNNPLYGNDVFRPSPIRPAFPNRPEVSPSDSFQPPSSDGGPSLRSFGLFRGNEPVTRPSHPARSSPITPSGPALPEWGAKKKRKNLTRSRSPAQPFTQPTAQATSATTQATAQPHRLRPVFTQPSIVDLVAAVRSDQALLIADVRKGAEPRVPGDYDRKFSPREGDIIVHNSPTPWDDKLVEYFDKRRTMMRLKVGDKLVRVKYNNFKIPNHLVITSKLYIYGPEWVYLGKAMQTIKMA